MVWTDTVHGGLSKPKSKLIRNNPARQKYSGTITPVHLSTLQSVLSILALWAMYSPAGVSVPEFSRLMAERAKVVPARQAA